MNFEILLAATISLRGGLMCYYIVTLGKSSDILYDLGLHFKWVGG